jgi:hypothetical protein
MYGRMALIINIAFFSDSFKQFDFLTKILALYAVLTEFAVLFMENERIILKWIVK